MTYGPQNYTVQPYGYVDWTLIIMFIGIVILLIVAIVAICYTKLLMIEKLENAWFKNKHTNYRREDKLYKEGRDGEKATNKPVMTQRELNDLIIKKFMK